MLVDYFESCESRLMNWCPSRITGEERVGGLSISIACINNFRMSWNSVGLLTEFYDISKKMIYRTSLGFFPGFLWRIAGNLARPRPYFYRKRDRIGHVQFTSQNFRLFLYVANETVWTYLKRFKKNFTAAPNKAQIDTLLLTEYIPCVHKFWLGLYNVCSCRSRKRARMCISHWK